MKSILNKIGIILTSAVLASSCSLDRYPLTSFSEETFYDDEANVKLALIGLY